VVRGLARATESLERELKTQLGEARGLYQPLGTDDANTAVMMQMLADRLDVLEATLLSLQAPPVRAEQPRNVERDNSSASRYYRALSEGTSPQQ
jgi:hypothetical protein